MSFFNLPTCPGFPNPGRDVAPYGDDAPYRDVACNVSTTRLQPFPGALDPIVLSFSATFSTFFNLVSRWNPGRGRGLVAIGFGAGLHSPVVEVFQQGAW